MTETRTRATGGTRDEQLTYWREQLRDAPSILELPTDRPRTSMNGSRAGRARIVFARREATTAGVLLAAFGVLLSRHTGEDDLVIGAPVGVDGALLALRLRLDGEPSFGDVLARVEKTMLEAQRNQDIAFEQPFAITFAHFGVAESRGHSNSELTLLARETPDGVELTLEYATALFDAETVERLAARYCVLLDAALARPETPIAALPVMSEAERHRVLVEWNETRAPYPRERSIHALFSEHARATPAAIALVFGGRTMTYRELDEASSRVAAALVDAGVSRDSHVGIASTRSFELIIGLLGILKAGGAYVPLDASYPEERLALLVEEAGVRFALDPDGELRLSPSVRTFATRALTSHEAPLRGNVDVGSRGAAYVLFTSGSTGTPKGVCVEHRSVVRLVRSIDWARMTPEDVFLCHAPLSFDASTLEIWAPLLNGARLVIAPPGVLGIEELAATIRGEGVTFLWLTSGLFNVLVDQDLDALVGARQVFAGGDVLSVAHVKRVRSALPHVKLVNGYGPTENTTFTTVHTVDTITDGVPIPIGKPITQTTAYVLDARGDPTPIGVPGELYAGGDGVARGYLGAEATAEKFVPDPFGGGGGRLYRTGDIARWRNDGTLEFLGRRDGQLKLRGFRIELGEIEAALMRTGVREAAVVAQVDARGDKHLVAYVVADAIDAKALESALGRTLPEYMIPSAFVRLDSLPLNPHGKIDRKALPAPDFAAHASEYVAPRNATEKALAEIFADVLALERVGVHDDFFALGGHSLTAAVIAGRVRRRLGVRVSVRALFQARTIEALAPIIDATPREVDAALIHTDRTLGALTTQESRLWFEQRLEPSSVTYNECAAIRVHGSIDVVALERALAQLEARHGALRTRYDDVEGVPQRRVVAPGKPALVRERASDERQAAELIAAHARAPYDLSRGPLWRPIVVDLENGEHVIALAMHHIITDEWSFDVLLRDLDALYGERARHGAAFDYADHAAADDASRSERDVRYFAERLAGIDPLVMPTDRPRSAQREVDGRTIRTSLGASLRDRVVALAREEGTTVPAVLLALYGLLAHRHTGQQRFAIGMPIAGRHRAELEDIVGFFVNTVAIDFDFSGEPTVRELVRQTREVTLDAQAHGEASFAAVVRATVRQRDASRPALCQIVFAPQPPDTHKRTFGGRATERFPVEMRVAKFELSLFARETKEGIDLELEYATALFDAETAERLAARYCVLLDAALASPETPVAALPVMPEAERHRVLVEWNETCAPYPRERSIHALFSEHARATPGAVALVYGGRTMSYRELDEASSRVAAALVDAGVSRDSHVGIASTRSFEMIVGLLGILKAGGAYVPLDASYPEERLALLVEEAGVRFALDPDGELRLPPSVRTLRTGALTSEERALQALADVGSRAAAYVLFTSGSTGTPKGVCVEHRSVVRLVVDNDWAHTTAEDVFLCYAPLAFDASTIEIWAPLLNGARLVIAPAGVLGTEELAAAIRGITSLFLTSGLLQVVVDQNLEALAGVRHLFTGGDVLSVAHVKRVRSALPHVRLVNAYGPTENTTVTTCHRVDAVTDGVPIPIGRPIAQTTAYVLDARGEPTPIGVPGELYTGGDGVARGYLRAEATAEKFVPDPFGGGGGRLYRTGDIARWRNDGIIEFLGRRDGQVKIRGFRIEVGEIETALVRAGAVREAAVVARVDARGDKHLVAYVVADAIDAKALESGLRRTLPEYMVPAVFVRLDSLPLDRNGKIDRKALPAPDFAARASEYVAPRNATEKALAEIFADVLGLERVGVHDDFFALGGHSLLATRVVSRIRTALHVVVSVRSIFDAPTVERLAVHLSSLRTDDAAETIPRVARDGDLPLSFGQEQLWFLQQLDPTSRAYDFPLAYHLSGPLDARAVERAVDELVHRHESLRVRFETVRGAAVLRIDPSKAIPLSVVDAHEKTPEDAVRAALRGSPPFDLARGPLFRPTLLRLAEREHVLLFEMHHIVTDGWSAEILLRDFAQLYDAFSKGLPSPLRPLEAQYVDYAAWQRARVDANVIDRQVAFHRKQLEGAPPALELPTDRPRPRTRTHRGAQEHLRLSPELRAKVVGLAQEANATWFMVVLAAYAAVLSRLAGQTDVVVGAPIALRDTPELEGVVGFFLNNLPVRVRVDRGSFRELLAQVRQTSLELHENRDVPFDTIVERLEPSRDPSRTPIFQVMLVAVNFPRAERKLGDIVVRNLDPSDLDAKVDLTVYAEEDASGISLQASYNVDLFDRERMRELLGEVAQLLEAATREPDVSVLRHSLVTPSARHVLPDPAVPLSEEWRGALPDVFARVAAARPDRIAVSDRTASWTYAELDARANQLAHELAARGVKKGDRVAIAASRSGAQVWATMGVLKAGAVFVMLDLAYPVPRLLQQLDIAQPRALVRVGDAPSWPEEIAQRCELRIDVPMLDAAKHAFSNQPTSRLDMTFAAGDPAYIAFTSGSTGVPKGILGPHGPLTHFQPWWCETFELTADDRFSLLSGLAHDPLHRDMFTPLQLGARVCSPEQDDIGTKRLHEWLARERITVLHVTPPLARLLADSAPADLPLKDVRRIFLVGDALTRRDINRLEALAPNAVFINYYGATETSRAVSCHRVARDETSNVVALGRGIEGVQLLVTTNEGLLAGVGEIGEIVFRTPHLTNGYVGDDELTRTKFTVSPLGPGRVYRTGDLGRYLPSGEVEFAGRSDRQVKIRGFRVELGEVERALSSHPEVRGVLVITRSDARGDTQIVAYVVPKTPSLGKAELRHAVQGRLPDYMVPGAVVFLDAIPLTPNGKVDRAALPEPEEDSSQGTTTAAEPGSVTEVVANIWKEVLDLDEIDIHADFFDLGGHSLLATRVVARIEEELGVTTPVRSVFDAATVARLAAVVEKEMLEQASPDALAAAVAEVRRGR